MPPEPPTPAPVERPRPVRPVRPGRLAAEVSLSRLAGEVHAALGLRPVLAVDDAGSLVVSLPAEFDEASLNAVVAAHVPDPPVVDSLGVLAAGVEPARTIAELKTALLDYVAAERARRTPMKEGS